MYNFVTLFDKGYLSRGLALYESLKNSCRESFVLHILAMDEYVADYFREHKKPEIVVETVSDYIEVYPELSEIREERTRAEFCWTLSPYSLYYTINKFHLQHCIYLDSDCYFYHDPGEIIREMQDCSVLITEHNYTPEYDQSATSGKFCVQFMVFKNDDNGMKVLEWWKSRCREWCYNRFEDGKFGDQRYLDDWESRFAEIVYNCNDLGCGVAPWNCQKYEIVRQDDTLCVRDRISKTVRPLVFFHFHGMTRLKEGKWLLSAYRLDRDFKLLFKKYIYLLLDIEQELPAELRMAEQDNPYIIKNKLRYVLRQSKNAFVKAMWGKPEYVNNIIRTGSK